MRCNDCGKFVPYGEPRTDEIEVEVAEDGSVTLSGSLYLTCENCGGDLSSASMDADANAAGLTWEGKVPEGAAVSYEMSDDADIAATDRHQTTDRKGKVIKKVRYMRRFFGVEATVQVRRTVKVGETFTTEEQTITLDAEEQASSFEAC